MATLQDLLSEKRYFDIWILARYFYRIGEAPIITDSVYDRMTNLFKEKCYDELHAYLDRTYDDDPIPYDLLEEIGVRPYVPVTKIGRNDLFDLLNEDKSLSIDSIVNYRSAYDFLMDKVDNKLDVVASLKMDGVNVKSLYQSGKFSLSLSRGRASNSFDFTDQAAYVLPAFINNDLPELRVTGECFVVKEGLEKLRAKYAQDKYKTSKSAAISLLRVKHSINDYKDLRLKVFAAEGLADTVIKTFEILKSFGFDVVPYLFIPWDTIPKDYDEFCVWLRDAVFQQMHDAQLAGDMPADGVVLEVNNYGWQDTISNQYSNRQIACKFDFWAFESYKAIVKEIVIVQRRVTASVRVKIEPMQTNDACEAKIINIFNPSILIHNDIKVGDFVYFERNSGAVNILIHGKRLDDLLKE
jgi:NAD-dependent DNA ligase